MNLITIPEWKDYELVDTGGFEKLERYGSYYISRPEPQALWQKSLSEKEWNSMFHARFTRLKEESGQSHIHSENGNWTLKPGMPDQWFINYSWNDLKMRFRLGLTSFKHLGIFPEQADNWNYIYNKVKLITDQKPKVLNLFAYTGASSLAAKAAGADVVHVDSVKQVISWSRANMEASGLQDIRWVVEDAMKFTANEVKRGNKYHAIILDPPAYGRGPQGEKWLLERDLNEMLSLCSKLLHTHDSFFVLNLYSMGFSSLILESLAKKHFPQIKNPDLGELFLTDRSKTRLPLGVLLRF